MQQAVIQHPHPRPRPESVHVFDDDLSSRFIKHPDNQILHDADNAIYQIDKALNEQASVSNKSQLRVVESAIAIRGICEANKISNEALKAAKQQNAQVLGRAALSSQISSEGYRQEKDNLSDLFERAARGDEFACQVNEINSISEVAEMICKSGSEMTATAQMVDGKLTQFGQTTEERQFNTLTIFTNHFPELQSMTEAEGQNAFLIEELYSKGAFQDGSKLVEISLVPDAAYEKLKGSGLFLREVVGIIRTTEIDTQGNVTIKSYLVGGTDPNDLPPPEQIKNEQHEAEVERQALANRFDIAVVREMLRRNGVDNAERLSPAEILATPLLLPKEADGIDLVMQYDDIASSASGKNMMLGGAVDCSSAQSRPARSEYIGHFETVNKMQQNLHEVGRAVARQCAERWKEVQGDPYAAGRLMHRLAEREAARYLYKMKKRRDDFEKSGVVYTMPMPDLTVLGAMAYQEIINNNLQGAMDHAKGTGCPSLNVKQSTSRDNEKGRDGLEADNRESSEEDDGPSDQFGPLRFQCPKGHWNTRKPAKSPKDFLEKCGKCGTDLSCKKK